MSLILSERGFHKPLVKALDEHGREINYNDFISNYESLLLLSEMQAHNLPPVAKSFLKKEAYNKMDPFGEDVFDDFNFNPNDFALTVIRKKSESARPLTITVLNSVKELEIKFDKRDSVQDLLHKVNTELQAGFILILTAFNAVLEKDDLLKSIYLDNHSVLAIKEEEINKLPKISERFFAYNVLSELKKQGRFPIKAVEDPFSEDVFNDFEFEDSDFNLNNIRKKVHVITTRGMIKVEYLASHTIEWLLLESTLLLKGKGLDEALIRAMAEDGAILKPTDLITHPALILLTANETIILPKVSEAFFTPDAVERLRNEGFYGKNALFNMQNNPFGEDVFNDFDFEDQDFSLTAIRRPKITITRAKKEELGPRERTLAVKRKSFRKSVEQDELIKQLKSKFTSEETLYSEDSGVGMKGELDTGNLDVPATHGEDVAVRPREANGIYDEDGFLVGRKYVPPQKNKENDKLISELKKVLKERNRKLAFRFAKAGLDFDHLII
ncbi:hypothetical protein HDV01_005745 [Terramyces sp. JEL0728]|nr:hypothetical protein HDV01_005745 [Terramyces sp. JEL0728]